MNKYDDDDVENWPYDPDIHGVRDWSILGYIMAFALIPVVLYVTFYLISCCS